MKMELFASGLQFPEGPIIMPDGSLLLVEIQRKTLTRIRADGGQEIVAELGGGPNGAAIGPDGAVYICNNGGMVFVAHDGMNVPHGVPDDYVSGSIQRVDPATGEVSTLYTSCDGRLLKGPNDIVFDDNGGFWFSDLGKMREEVSDVGALYYAKADGSFITRAHFPMYAPNGVGLSPDGKTVWVAESLTSRVWGFEIVGPGQLNGANNAWAPGNVLGPLPGFQLLDSLAVEANGNVCVATIVNGGITVFSPAGGTEHIPTPDALTTNICFGGDDMQDAWITCSGSGTIYKTRWPRPGLQLNY